jgi:iron complex outermembrane recepter protein
MKFGTVAIAFWLVSNHAAFGQQVAQSTQPNSAQPENAGLEEVVVTAQRRSENLQRVPISVTALSEEKLQAANIVTTADLAAVTPSLTYSNVNGNIEPRIRGIGNSTAGASVENSVATYIDGVYIASASGSLLNLSNIARVEVLDGPQGTLFGRNATGGLVQIITKDPESTFGGNGDISYGNYNTVRSDLYVTGPIFSNVDADLALYGSHQGQGWGTDLYNSQPTYRVDRDYAARSKWVAHFGDTTTIHLAFDYTNWLSSAPGVSTADGLRTIFQPIPPAIQAAENSNPFDDYANDSSVRKLETGGTSIRIDQDAGPVTLTDITAYRRNDYHVSYDSDETPLQANQQLFTWEDTEVTEEFQIAPSHSDKLQWIAGIYIFHLASDYEPLTVLSGAPPAQTNSSAYDDFTTESLAGYGQATYEFLPATRLTAGFRYTYEKRSEQGDTVTVSGTGPEKVTPLKYSSFVTDTPTWRLALDHDFTDQILGYISWNRGFKSGGYNPTSPAQPAYKPETLDAFEVGEKSTVFDGKLRLNAAFFYYKYKDIQVNAIVNTLGVIYNGARAEDYGLDATFDFSVTPELMLTGGVVALHDRFTDFPDAVIAHVNPNDTTSTEVGSAAGNRLPFAPDETVNLGVDYKKHVTRGDASIFVNELWNSGYYTQPDNFLHQSAYHMLNATFSYHPDNSAFTYKLWGRNLANATIAEFLSISSAGPSASYEAPRTYGISLGYKF